MWLPLITEQALDFIGVVDTNLNPIQIPTQLIARTTKTKRNQDTGNKTPEVCGPGDKRQYTQQG